MTHTLRGDDGTRDIIETSCFAESRPSTSQRHHVIVRCATLQSVTYTPSLGQNERAVAVLACHWTNLMDKPCSAKVRRAIAIAARPEFEIVVTRHPGLTPRPSSGPNNIP